MSATLPSPPSSSSSPDVAINSNGSMLFLTSHESENSNTNPTNFAVKMIELNKEPLNSTSSLETTNVQKVTADPSIQCENKLNGYLEPSFETSQGQLAPIEPQTESNHIANISEVIEKFSTEIQCNNFDSEIRKDSDVEPQISDELSSEVKSSEVEPQISDELGLEVKSPEVEPQISDELGSEVKTPDVEPQMSDELSLEVKTPEVEPQISDELGSEVKSPDVEPQISEELGSEVKPADVEPQISDELGSEVKSPNFEPKILNELSSKKIDPEPQSSVDSSPDDSDQSNPEKSICLESESNEELLNSEPELSNNLNLENSLKSDSSLPNDLEVNLSPRNAEQSKNESNLSENLVSEPQPCSSNLPEPDFHAASEGQHDDEFLLPLKTEPKVVTEQENETPSESLTQTETAQDIIDEQSCENNASEEKSVSELNIENEDNSKALIKVSELNNLENVDLLNQELKQEEAIEQTENSSDNHPMIRNYKQQLRERRLNGILNNDYITADYDINRLLPKKRIARVKSSQDIVKSEIATTSVQVSSPSNEESQPGPSRKIAKTKSKSPKVRKVPRNLGSFENKLSKDDLESLLYTSDLSLLSTETLKRTVKALKNQTRNLRKPVPTLQEKIEDIEFSCFSSEKDFENYSKFEVKDVSERLLQRKLQDEKKNERASTSSQFHVDVPRVRGSRRQATPFRTRRSQATVPYRDQFDYQMDFLDDEEMYSPHMDLDFEAVPTTSTPTSSTSSPVRKKKSNIIFINGPSNECKNKPNETISATVAESGTKRPLSLPQMDVSNRQISPNKRMKVIISGNHLNKPHLYPTTVNDRSMFLHDDSDENRSIDNANGVRRFEKLIPEMLCDVSDDHERRNLYTQFFKIVTKLYVRCRTSQSQIYQDRYRKSMVKQIKGDDAIKEIKKQLRPPRPIIPQKSNPSQIVFFPPSANGVSISTANKVGTPISTTGFKPQVVNRKLIFTPQVIKPAAVSITNTPSTSRVGVTVNSSSNSTGVSSNTTLINSGNIKLAPNAKQLIVRHLNSDGKPSISQPQKTIYILKSTNGQPATLVPLNSSTYSTSNGQPQPMRVVLSKPGVPITGKTITTTASPATNTVTSNSSFIRLNSNSVTSNSIKLVLNPSNNPNTALHNIKSSSFRIGQSPATGGQHILIGGGSNKISTGVGGKIFAIKPSVQVAATSVAPATVSSSSVISNFNSRSISSLPGINRFNSSHIGQPNNTNNTSGQLILQTPCNKAVVASTDTFTDISTGLSSLLVKSQHNLPSSKSDTSNMFCPQDAVNINSSNCFSAFASNQPNIQFEPMETFEPIDEQYFFVDGYQNLSQHTTEGSLLAIPEKNHILSHSNIRHSHTSLLAPPEDNKKFSLPNLHSEFIQEQNDDNDDDDEPILWVPNEQLTSKSTEMSEAISTIKPNYSPIEAIPLDLNKPYTILAHLLYSLYFHVPDNSRPFQTEMLLALLPQFLLQNYTGLCNDVLRTIFHLDNESKQLLHQLRHELSRQNELLQRFNDLKAEQSQVNVTAVGSVQPIEDIHFNLIKPRRTVEFTIHKVKENKFRLSMQKVLRKEINAITKEKRDSINLKTVLLYEQICNEQLTKIAAANVGVIGTNCFRNLLCK